MMRPKVTVIYNQLRFHRRPSLYTVTVSILAICIWLIVVNLALSYQITYLQHEEPGRNAPCSCQMPYFYGKTYNQFNNTNNRLNSSCSDEATFYTTGQRVISMSLYLESPWPWGAGILAMYLKGIQLNLNAIRTHYPGHTLRIYTDVPLFSGLCHFLCQNADLLWCQVTKTPSLGDQSEMFGMTWRFLPLGDPTVDYFLSRDLDSAIMEREAMAVNDWLNNSKKAVHVMRDSPFHDIPILGGMWGASNSRFGMEAAANLRKKIIVLSKIGDYKKKGGDQDILNWLIFKKMPEKIVAHDSYHCRSYNQTQVRPFPLRRKNAPRNFIGARLNDYDGSKLWDCPRKCRPKYGKNWKYC